MKRRLERLQCLRDVSSSLGCSHGFMTAGLRWASDCQFCLRIWRGAEDSDCLFLCELRRSFGGLVSGCKVRNMSRNSGNVDRAYNS